MERSSQIELFTWINHTNSDPNADMACILNDLLWKMNVECRMLIHSIYSIFNTIRKSIFSNAKLFIYSSLFEMTHGRWTVSYRIHWYSKFETIAHSSNFIRTKSSYKRKMFDHRLYFISINRCSNELVSIFLSHE